MLSWVQFNLDMKPHKKISKQDELNHLYLSAVSSVKLKGVLISQREIYSLVSAVVSKKTSIEPLHTSYDIQSQTYLKILDWLQTGKRGQSLSVEQILAPAHIRKTASSFGFSAAKYPAPVCRLEDWSPIEHISIEESPSNESPLLDTWLKYQDKLDAIARAFLTNPTGFLAKRGQCRQGL